ncbi:MAG: hypothetical protein JW821_02045 [Deltaproteobacteria bacterium]|nr:hypothetical protein [Deltaproteobacteria bacterium]
MDTTLFDKSGEAIAYIASDYRGTIYLWEGEPVAYLHEETHVYGFNGRHLGWFVDGILYDHAGQRVGFLFSTCPVPSGEEPRKGKKYPAYEARPKWTAPPLPKLTYALADQGLAEFLAQGQVLAYREESETEEESPD